MAWENIKDKTIYRVLGTPHVCPLFAKYFKNQRHQIASIQFCALFDI